MKTLEKALLLALFCLELLFPLEGWAQSVQMVDDSTPVRWHRSEIDFVVDPSLAVGETSIKDPVTLIQQIAATWEAVDSHVPHFRVRAGSLGEPGYDEHLPDSENRSGVRLYRHDFPRERNMAVLALTLLTRNSVTGEVVDADIIIDAERNRFTELGGAEMFGVSGAPNDFRNVLTHEFGHALGLVEDAEHPDATMFPSSQPGEIHKRDVADSDRASITFVYGWTRWDTFKRSLPHVATILWCLLIVLIVARSLRERRRARHSFLYVAVALLILTGGYPSVRPQTTEHGLVVATRSFWSGGLMRTVATVQTAHGLTRVERLGGRIGTLEQRVLDAPSGHELQTGTHVPVEN